MQTQTAKIPDFIPIDNNPGLHRDVKSHGIVSGDRKALDRARLQKLSVVQMRDKLLKTEREVGTLKEQMAELTQIVQNMKAKY